MTAVQQQRIVDKARDKALDSARARVIELEEALLAQGRRAASAVKPRIFVSRRLAGALLDRGARGAQRRPQGPAVEHGGLGTTRQPEKDSGARLPALDPLRR